MVIPGAETEHYSAIRIPYNNINFEYGSEPFIFSGANIKELHSTSDGNDLIL